LPYPLFHSPALSSLIFLSLLSLTPCLPLEEGPFNLNQLRDLGECTKLPQQGLGGAAAEYEFGAL